MTVEKLIKLLESFPLEAQIQKCSLNDDTGSSDSEMTAEDWSLAENVIGKDGEPLQKKIVCCIFD